MRLRDNDVTWQEIDGELVILDLATSNYLTTNAAGALLAKRLQQPATLEDLVSVLVAEYSIEQDVARRDAEAFVADLDDRGLLTQD